jgi:hypothetical protein
MMVVRSLIVLSFILLFFGEGKTQSLAPISREDSLFLRTLQRKSFEYFWQIADPGTGLVRDRSADWSPCSIAAAGFGLTSI